MNGITKTCTKCGATRPVAEFTVDNKTKDGRTTHCRVCRREVARRWKAENRARAAAQNTVWYAMNHRKANLRKLYGLSLEQYDAMVAAQGNLCAVCARPQDERWHRNLAVDHCHQTGMLRGLLCNLCNKGIGNLGDDPARLRAAAAYIERHAAAHRAQPSAPIPLYARAKRSA